MQQYLVVANQTLAGNALADELCARAGRERCRFHVVVPATRPHDHVVWTEGEARAIASRRLEEALAWFGGLGLDVDGEVGDERAFDAVRDALREARYDGVILSTLPSGVSRWIGQDLPNRLTRAFGIPVHHIVGASWTVPTGS
ncbi:MAG TPA: hypothetical protein VFC33_14490 [Acidimicrobiia bacterium]|nr:hypothetical protein [Acidimicrobiia bacterium]